MLEREVALQRAARESAKPRSTRPDAWLRFALRGHGGRAHLAQPLWPDDEKAWAGQTRHWPSPTAEGWEVIVGLAGLGAEACDGGERCPQQMAEEIQAAEEFELISATDLAPMGWDWWTDDVQRTLSVLIPVWAEVLTETACLQSYACDEVAPCDKNDATRLVALPQDVR